MDEIKGIRIVSLTGEKEYGIEDSEVREDVQQIVEGAPEAFDTFREIAEYIAEDGATAAEIIKNVAANTQGIADEITRAKAAEEELEVQIADEALRATAALAAEKARAEQAETGLDKKITEEAKITDEKIAKEKTRAETVEQALANDIANAANLALRALFIAAGAEYNDSGTDKTKTAPWGETVTHKAEHYYLNGLGDITEDQMQKIYVRGWFNAVEYAPLAYGGANSIRTNIGRVGMSNGAYSQGYFAFENSTIEVINCSDGFFNFDNPSNLFYGNERLKVIIGKLWFGKNSTTDFVGCTALHELQVRELSKSMTLSNSPLVSKKSILYMIQKAKPATAITITLHPDAYARLNPDLEENADIKSALEAQPFITLASA